MRDLCGFTLKKLLDSFRQTNPLPSRIYACFVAFAPRASCCAFSHRQQVKCFLRRGLEGLCDGLWDPLGRAVLSLTDDPGLL